MWPRTKVPLSFYDVAHRETREPGKIHRVHDIEGGRDLRDVHIVKKKPTLTFVAILAHAIMSVPGGS